MPFITLTTDFGHQDPFVGIMKGVILGIAPDVRLVDLCHEIAPQDLIGAAIRLEAALPYFPKGAIHLVVVDPGVGTDRAAIALETQNAFLIGPDNGILPAALGGLDPIVRAVRLTDSRYHHNPVSATFHGRDIFAPCAAHLATGVPLTELGEPFENPLDLRLPQPEWRDGAWHAHVLGADRFGNLITDVRSEHLKRLSTIAEIVIGDRKVPLKRTYADVGPGELVAYIGSMDRLEIAVRNGSATEAHGERLELSIVSADEQPDEERAG